MTARTNGLKSVTFHHGETYLQQSVDFREQAEAMYTSFIRPAMPQQHQTFYANLPYMIMGSIDSHGRPWASFLTGPPGFITSPDARHLKLTVTPLHGDPVMRVLETPGTEESTQVGFLGIEFPTRRRNRVNGRIQKAVRKERGFEVGVKVVQSFGNCPKYIQAREIVGERKVVEKERVVMKEVLEGRLLEIVENTDTIFVATRYIKKDGVVTDEPLTSSGVDASHRGGNPGFVKVVNGGKAIAWPDYKGNNMFMTLGNILQDPRAGILIPDFDTGDILYATGRAELLINDAASTYFPGFTRVTVLTIDECYLSPSSLPYLFQFTDWSPFNPPVRPSNEKLIPVTLLGVQKEAENLATFTFEVKDGITYTPGQHVTLDFSKDATAIAKKEWLKKSYNSEVYHNDDLVRTWTLTSCPDVNEDLSFKSATTFTITVKRDPNGMLSTLLHDQYTKHINTTPPQIHLRGLSGSFTIHNANPSLQPPIHPSNNRILFLAGGVGITPVVGLIKGLVKRAEVKRRESWDVVVVVSVSMGAEVPGTLILGLMEMAGRVEGVGVRVVVYVSNGDVEWDGVKVRRGRVSGESLVEDVGDVKERSVMVCGPPGYMGAVEGILEDVGVDKENVFTESFAY